MNTEQIQEKAKEYAQEQCKVTIDLTLNPIEIAHLCATDYSAGYTQAMQDMAGIAVEFAEWADYNAQTDFGSSGKWFMNNCAQGVLYATTDLFTIFLTSRTAQPTKP